jgi:hypothetical protein
MRTALILSAAAHPAPHPPSAAVVLLWAVLIAVVAALVALATITGGTPQAESRLARHVAARAVRLRAVRAAA